MVSRGAKETLSRTEGRTEMPLLMRHQEGKERGGRNFELGVRKPGVKTSFCHLLTF